jgi:hypothetical protein
VALTRTRKFLLPWQLGSHQVVLPVGVGTTYPATSTAVDYVANVLTLWYDLKIGTTLTTQTVGIVAEGTAVDGVELATAMASSGSEDVWIVYLLPPA